MEHKPFTVRSARQEDAWEIARLLSIFDSQMIAQSQFIQRMQALQEIETALLAESDGHVIGLACLRLAPSLSTETPHAEVTELWVDKAFQGNGVEQALIARMEALASTRGALYLILLTGLKNHESQGLYRELGFREFALAMRKTLPIIGIEY